MNPIISGVIDITTTIIQLDLSMSGLEAKRIGQMLRPTIRSRTTRHGLECAFMAACGNPGKVKTYYVMVQSSQLRLTEPCTPL